MDEFLFLDHLKQHFKLGKIGDDCAVLPLDEGTDLLVTSDMLVEGIDFRLEWTTPDVLGHKALAVSLSDVAAMGGVPLWALISVAVPERLWNQQFLDEFYTGLKALADIHDVEIVGGDVSETGERLVVDSTVLGRSPEGGPVFRTGARPGDLVFVSGELGSAAAGLHLLEHFKRQELVPPEARALIKKQLKPIPRNRLGNLLTKGRLATSMIDLSDGLSSDLKHLCDASGTGAVVRSDQIPISRVLKAIALDRPDLALPDPVSLALNGGEDFELLFTAAREDEAKIAGLGCVSIGEVTGHSGQIELVVEGTSRPMEPRGFAHFR